MTSPLNTEYDVTYSPLPEGFLGEGEDAIRGVVEFENGYGVSFVRTNIDRDGIVPSRGYDQGNWEAVIIRPATSPIVKMFGWTYEPAEELGHLLNDEVEGFDADSLNHLFGQVKAQPQWVAPLVEPDEELFSFVFADVFDDEGEANEEEPA